MDDKLEKKCVKVSDEDRDRLDRLAEEIYGKMNEFSMVQARILNHRSKLGISSITFGIAIEGTNPETGHTVCWDTDQGVCCIGKCPC